MLISINQAAKRGITKLRLDKWAIPDDYIEIYVADKEGHLGPWAKLFSPINDAINGRNPVAMLITMLGDPDNECWRPL